MHFHDYCEQKLMYKVMENFYQANVNKRKQHKMLTSEKIVKG